MISKSKLLWDSRWPTSELTLSTSVREILGVILKYDKRFPCWFICPIQSHNDISCMSYHRLSWFTLSIVEWWVRLRKGTCHLPVFLLCVPISLLASKCLVRQLPTLGIVIHFHPDNSTTTQPKISIVCLSTSKRVKKILQKLPLKILNSGRTWVIFFKKKKKKKKCPWSLAKMVQKRSSIKWPKNISKVWVHFSLSPEHLWFHKIGIWSSTYLLRTTLRLGNIGNQAKSQSSNP